MLLSKLVSQIVTSIGSRVGINAIICWSDSEVALAWIRGKEKSWKPWVENRVVETRKVVDRAGWRYVKSGLNPADVPTRISSNICESFTGCWFEGPSFLVSLKDYAEVEVENSGGGEISQVGMAEVANFSNQTHKGQDNQKCSLSSVINSDRFSSLKKLILVTGYVLRFVNNLRKRVKKETNLITEDMITVTEYNEALIMWIKDEQFQLKQQDNYSKLEASLHLFEDKDGVLRLRGRFANASLQYEEQYPIILRNRQRYLNELRQMNIYRKTKGENTRRISVGDVVLIKDDELSVRTQWRMGKVLELAKGRDVQIRGAKLKVLSKTGKQTAVFRPLQRLIPFEINENHDCTSKQQPKESKDSVNKDENVNEAAVTVNEETSAKRQTRKAAVEGQNLRRLREQ